jgi:CRISPR-associated protein Cas1
MRKLQNSLYITRDGAYLHKQRETLVIEQNKQKLLQVPIHAISGIFCFGNIMVSPQLMGFCGEKGVNLAFFTPYGRYLARVQGKQSGNVLLRRQQYNLVDEQSANIAKNIIAAKVQSSKAVLQRHNRNHGPNEDITKQVSALNHIIERLALQTDLDKIRGFEGEAASRYFAVFNQLITKKGSPLVFNGRTRRPPKDPINAMLSFLYSVFGQDVSAALQGVGLDPQVGFLHQERPGRDSLGLDLLEEFRAYIIDRIVLTLINREQVKADDFVTEVSGAVKMKDDTRKLLLQTLQEKKQEKIMHPFLKEEIEVGLLAHVQAMLLARHIRGDLDQYPPFSIK